MASLVIDNAGNKVQVAELALIAGKQQMVLGGLEQDLILRTSGNINIQVGNKFYPLTYSSSSTSSNTITSDTTILALDSELSGLVYPRDGRYVFIQQSSSFYIASNNSYVKLNTSTSTATGPIPIVGNNIMYLSYSTIQKLNGGEKLQLVLNAGHINSFADISNYTKVDVYTNQLLYSITDNKHYVLVNTANPSIKSSWKELYVSLLTGGNILAPISITLDDTSVLTNSALHITGDAPSLFLIPKNPTPILTIGASDYSSGLATWTNTGNVYFQLLNPSKYSTFSFLSQNGNNILAASNNNVSINAPLDYNYTLSIGGNTFFKGSLNQVGNTTSTDFLQGSTGFSISKDSSLLWTIETDNLIVRNQLTFDPSYHTRGIDGAQIVANDIIISDVDYVETFPIYIHANVSGQYTNTSGTVRQLSSRATNAYVIHTSLSTIDTSSPTQVYELIPLAYGIGDIFTSGSTLDTTTTYNQDISTSYYTPVGTVDYSGGSFITGNTLLQINSISVYFIATKTTLIVGDLLYYKSWNSNSQSTSNIRAEVVLVVSNGYYLYIYDEGTITNSTRLVKIGNVNGTGGFIQTNSSNILSPFTELVSGITSFNAFTQNYYYEQSTDYPVTFDFIQNNWTSKLNTRVKIGDLSNVYDSTLGLTTQQYGLYSDNAYIKGNFIINNVPTIVSPITYDDFVMITSSGTLEKIDLNAKIAHWDSGGSAYTFTGLSSQWTDGTGAYHTFPTNLSAFTNGPGYLTTEVDPTVPTYAKSLTTFSVIQASTDTLYTRISDIRNAANFGLTTSLADVGHYDNPAAGDQTYRVGAWVNLLSTSGKTLTVQVTWTDNHSISQTKVFFPQGATSSTLGVAPTFYSLPTMDFRVLTGTTVQVSTTVSGSGTILYEVGTTITKIIGI
jgi:hypothetical protein